MRTQPVGQCSGRVFPFTCCPTCQSSLAPPTQAHRKCAVPVPCQSSSQQRSRTELKQNAGAGTVQTKEIYLGPGSGGTGSKEQGSLIDKTTTPKRAEHQQCDLSWAQVGGQVSYEEGPEAWLAPGRLCLCLPNPDQVPGPTAWLPWLAGAQGRIRLGCGAPAGLSRTSGDQGTV
jgi:hypothetical protein